MSKSSNYPKCFINISRIDICVKCKYVGLNFYLRIYFWKKNWRFLIKFFLANLICANSHYYEVFSNKICCMVISSFVGIFQVTGTYFSNVSRINWKMKSNRSWTNKGLETIQCKMKFSLPYRACEWHPSSMKTWTTDSSIMGL